MTDRSDVAVVILAAGQGTRFKSDLAKVLHLAAGRSMLGHVLAATDELGLGQVVVVVGHQSEAVTEDAATQDRRVTTALQAEQLGTGHAAQQALPVLDAAIQRIAILPGDTPLLTPDTLAALIDAATADVAGVLLTTFPADATGYGRVLRGDGPSSGVERIVEHKDASADERAVGEVNAGMYVFRRDLLEPALAALEDDNAQGELYLTDVVEALVRDGHTIAGHVAPVDEVAGVNDRAQLAAAAAVLRTRIADGLMAQGVTIVDPATTYIDVGVTIGTDTVVLPGCLLQGDTHIGANATIGPYSQVVDSTIEDGATIAQSVVKGASVGPDASVGPFSYLRPGTRLERGAKAGGFVEVKQSTIGEGAKVPHLSYIGDATIGAGANIGAGTITCNYDGFDKFETHIGDGAFVGSDTMLVAPVTIGRGAVIGAGSVITEDVPDDALAVERSEQTVREGWAAARRERKGR